VGAILARMPVGTGASVAKADPTANTVARMPIMMFFFMRVLGLVFMYKNLSTTLIKHRSSLDNTSGQQL